MPKRPRLIDKRISPDLEAICLKSLAKQPADRYRSVEHFAEDLRRWQHNLPVEARRINALQRTGKWVRRHPVATTLTSLLAIVLLSVTIFFQTRAAWLHLRVTPAKNVKVTIDQQRILLGSDGRALTPLSPGKHRLVITSPDHEPHEQDIQLMRGRENALVVTATLVARFGYVSIASKPEGAAMQIRDKAGNRVTDGVTPFHSARLPSAEYTGHIQKELYEPESISFMVPHGEQLNRLAPVSLKPKYKESANGDLVADVTKRLAQPTQPLALNNLPWPEVLSKLSASEQLKLVLDDRSIDLGRVSRTTRISLNSQGRQTGAVLDSILQPLKLAIHPEFQGDGWQLLITTEIKAELSPFVVVHSVKDLLGERGDYNGLLERIVASIDTQSWTEVGGAGIIAVDHRQGTISVTQKWSTQRKVYEYLVNLRQANLASVNSAPSAPEMIKAIDKIMALGGHLRLVNAAPNAGISEFWLGLTPVVDTDLAEFPPLPELTLASLHQTKITNSGLAFLKNSPRLKHASLMVTQISDDGLEFVKSTPELVHLEVVSTLVGDRDLEPLRNHPALRTVQLIGTRLDDGGMLTLSTIPTLTELYIGNTSVTDKGVEHLAGHQNLYRLNMMTTACGDGCVPALLTMRSLCDISLGTAATNLSLDKLKAKKNVNTLMLSDTQITPAGLDHLSEFPRLTKLNLHGKKFTDAVVPYLTNLQNIRRLSISGSAVSKNGAKALRSRFPEAQIYVNGVNY